MGRKKKKPVKPWCWYCNREFDDDKILIQHQRAKHFKCPFCHKKLYSGPGVTVHCIQVHKETLDKIPESLPNRNSVDIDIYGMQGIPEEDLREHERLKRGDDASYKSNPEQPPKTQQPTASQMNNANYQGMSAMQAAMFQHALGMGAMPGFPMAPPMTGYSVMGGPSGFPPMLPPPGMPGSLPALGGYPVGYMQAPPPPPPPPLPAPAMANPLIAPPPSLFAGGFSVPPPPLGPLASTSGGDIPPPLLPLSGVGHLIGVPPPGPPTTMMDFHQTQANPPSIGRKDGDNYESRDSYEQSKSNSEQRQSHRSQAPPTTNIKQEPRSSSIDQGPSQNAPKPQTSSSPPPPPPPQSTTTTQTTKNLHDTVDGRKPDKFIEIANTNSRIMHSNRDLCLEELRLGSKRYSTPMGKV